MSSQQVHQQQQQSSSSYKSTTVSVLDKVGLSGIPASSLSSEQSPSGLPPPPPHFRSLIETEKCVAYEEDERELIDVTRTVINSVLHTNSKNEESVPELINAIPRDSINHAPPSPSVVVVMSCSSSVVAADLLTDDDEFECDREINQITNDRGSNAGTGKTSPEPSGNLELAGLRTTGDDDQVTTTTSSSTASSIRIGMSETVDVVGSTSSRNLPTTEYDEDTRELISSQPDLEISDDSTKPGSIQNGGGVEFQEFVVGTSAFNMSSKTQKSSTKSISSSYSSSSTKTVQQSISSGDNTVSINEASKSSTFTESVENGNKSTSSMDTATNNSSTTALNGVDEGAKKKTTKVERKTSKAGAGKKSKNAEISKENISVDPTQAPDPDQQQQTPQDAQVVAPQSVLIPEDLAKKLGPGESRVFAKVCVANLRRSFGDLTALTNVVPSAELAPPACSNNKFSGSNSLEYNRINSQHFKKSSFSKFDSLVAKNNSSSSNNNSAATISSAEKLQEEGMVKSEPKKLYCASCEKQVFQMELIRAEKKDWHKNCFRCVTCRKVLGVDTYQSHEQRLYCKPHFKELFQPKAVHDEQDGESETTRSSSSAKNSKLQLIICESQPKELPPDVVRASDAPTTGLEDIQIDVRSKFEMFEGLKESRDKSPEPLVVKRSASVLAKLKKYENSLTNGNAAEGVSDEDMHGVDAIELQSDEDERDDEDNSVIKNEIKRKLKNPLQALNEIAHFKQMDQVRSKWEEGTFTRDQINADSRKEELQKFRSRLCQGKSGQLKELYEKGVESGGESLSDARRAEIEEMRSERARTFREMFERGEVIRGEEDDEEETQQNGKASRNGVDLEVFEAGVARESKRLFEELDKKIVSEKDSLDAAAAAATGKRNANKFTTVKMPVSKASFSGGDSQPGTPVDIVRCSDKKEEGVVVNTAELSNKFKFFETYQEEMVKKAQEAKRDGFKRITPPREQGVVKTEKDYDETDESYRDPNVIRHGESDQDDTLQKSKTTSKMLSVFRQMEENLRDRETSGKDPIIRPLKQFTPPRDTVGSSANGRVVDSEEEEDDEEERERDDEEDEEEEEEEEQQHRREDDFLKEVGSLARARSLRAKFERWEQQENERNRAQGTVQEELAESIESAKNLKAKFEAMRLMGDVAGGGVGGGAGSGGSSNKENGHSPVPIKVNRFVLNTNVNSSSSSSSTSTSPQQLTQFCAFNSLPADVTNHHHTFHHHHSNNFHNNASSNNLIMSSNEQCTVCEKKVYVMEKIEAGGKTYHKTCFRCSHCKSILRMGNFSINQEVLYCTNHFKQLFKIKGNYNEGFGHETQYQQWAKNKQAQAQQN